MAKNEVAKKGSTTPASYNEKDFSSRTAANTTDIHTETVVTETSSSKRK